MTRPIMIPKTATTQNRRIPAKVQLQRAALRFVERHHAAVCRFFRFIDALPFRTLGAFFVWLGVKFAEHGYHAVEFIDKDTGFCALILIPVGVYFVLHDWSKVIK